MQKLPVSLVVITLNEEKNIERCIRSAPFVSDVVVVDSGSTDKTVEIARKLGARVLVEFWRGYAKQKIRAQALAQNDWVLSLDADEALSPNAQKEIEALVTKGLTADAYAMPRMTYHLGQFMRHGGMYPDYQARLYNRNKAKWLDTNVHEHVVAENVVRLNEPILHWSFDNIVQQIETINKYSSLRAIDFKQSGKTFSVAKMVVKPFSKFIECYFVKQGFRDGMAGLIVAFVSAFATFLRWAKLYELELSKGAPQNENSQVGPKG